VGVRWAGEVPELEGLLFSNEWLDDVPLDVLHDDRVVEVTPDGEESLAEPASDELVTWRRRWWPQGSRVEVGVTRDRAWAAAVGKVRRGLAVTVDYGHVLGDRRVFGDRRPSLTGWREGRPTHAIPDGQRDLTAHVAFDSLLAATGGRLVTQREALGSLGVRSSPPARELAKADPHGYLAQATEAAQAAELLDPRGFGGYGWLLVPVRIADPLLPSPP
jgi:SAM-dependent MidA family methyltransferase